MVALTGCYHNLLRTLGGRLSAMVDIALRTRPTLRGTVAAVALAWLLPGAAAAQSMWDDAAFVLYRQGVDAMDAKDFAKAAALARDATAAYPEHVLAFYLLGRPPSPSRDGRTRCRRSPR